MEALGLVKYDFTCLRDEKARLINDFSWGIESESAKSNNFSTEEGTIIVETKEFELPDWQRHAAYATVGLNLLFALCLIFYIVSKCCCRCRGVGCCLDKRVKHALDN